MPETPRNTGECAVHQLFSETMSKNMEAIVKCIEEMKTDHKEGWRDHKQYVEDRIQAFEQRVLLVEQSNKNLEINNAHLQSIVEESGRNSIEIKDQLHNMSSKVDAIFNAFMKMQGADEAKKEIAVQKKNSPENKSKLFGAVPDTNTTRALLIAVVALAIVILILLGVNFGDIIKVIKP